MKSWNKILLVQIKSFELKFTMINWLILELQDTTDPLEISITTIDVQCKDDENTGSATVVATGGWGDYIYEWSTNPVQTNSVATGLEAGSYFVTEYSKTDIGETEASVNLNIG